MKRTPLILLVLLLSAVGVFFGWRYYRDVLAPEREITEALEAQTALLEQLRPDLEGPGTPAEPGVSVAEPTAGPTDTPETAAAEPLASEAPVDPLEALRAFNRDTVAWLTIAGTSVDYPIVQTEDNEHYLRTGFDQTYNYIGCPFLDYRCDGGFGGFTSIVYGHSMPKWGVMFTELVNYSDEAYLRSHAYGKLLTRDGIHEVTFFAYLTVSSTSFVYRTQFVTRGEREEYLDGLFEAASAVFGVTPEDLKQAPSLRLLLLSTCTYAYEEARGVLVGVIG